MYTRSSALTKRRRPVERFDFCFALSLPAADARRPTTRPPTGYGGLEGLGPAAERNELVRSCVPVRRRSVVEHVIVSLSCVTASARSHARTCRRNSLWANRSGPDVVGSSRGFPSARPSGKSFTACSIFLNDTCPFNVVYVLQKIWYFRRNFRFLNNCTLQNSFRTLI